MSIKVGFRKVWVKKSLFSNDVHLSMMLIYIYIEIQSQKSSKCVYIKRKLKTHFFLQIFWCLYEIFYSAYGSNISQEDVLTAIIKIKLNEIKM